MMNVASLLIVALLGCGPKDASFFSPPLFDGPIVPPPPPPTDRTPPVISGVEPGTNVVLNDQTLCFVTVDGTGPQGDPISGVNGASITATSSTGAPLPVSQSPTSTEYIVDISSLPEGLNTVTVRVSDNAGNQSTTVIVFRKDRTAPAIDASVPATGSTTQPTATVNITGQISDQFGLSAAVMYVRQPVSGSCVVNGPLFPQGTTAGTVGQNTYDLGASGAIGLSVLTTGAPDDMRPRTTTYCFHFQAADQGVTKDGAARPNTADRLYPLTFTWQPLPPALGTITGQVTVNGAPLAGVTVTTGTLSQQTNANGIYSFTGLVPGNYAVTVSNLPSDVSCVPSTKNGTVTAGNTTVIDFPCTRIQIGFAIQLQMRYVHVGPGISFACVVISTSTTSTSSHRSASSAALPPGAAYTVAWSGPGVVGGTQRSNSLDANAMALDRQQIDQFGTYNVTVSVTSGGVTRQATGSVNVTSPQGTCTPP
jgi:hypothetical protein